MFLYEVLQLLRPCLLAFLIELDPVVVLYDLLDASPEELNHLGHVVRLALQVSLLVLQQLLFFDKALLKFFAAHTCLLLGITLLLLTLALEVLLHPEHLLDQVLVVGLCDSFTFIVNGSLEHFSLIFEIRCCLGFTSLLLQFFQLGLQAGLFCANERHLDLLALKLDDKLFKGQFGLVATFLLTFALQ